jgi:CPA1 family monovalent cation:H+ antiporter
MSGFPGTETLIVLLVLVATLVAIVARRIRLPYTVSLVLVGLLITLLRPQALHVTVTPSLILDAFLPPIIFEAAFHLDFRALRRNLAMIANLAVPGIVLTALIIGGIVAVGTQLPLGISIVFGALMAATDPIAVTSLFRQLGVPRRLALTVEAESLFNDGTAIVVFQIAVAAALTGSFSLVGGVEDFLKVSAGGLAIGVSLGWLVSQVIARVDDRLVVTTFTALLAYGAYLAADRLGFSGVLSVAAAGLMSGSVGLGHASPTTKNMLYNLWEFLGFLANSLVFLLIGLNVDLFELRTNLLPIGVAVGGVLISRAAAVYGLSYLAEIGREAPRLPLRWRHVLFWGGLRGAVSLALVLGLPTALAQRGTLQSMAFGVVLFTLAAQGTTIQFLLKWLGLAERPEYRIENETSVGRLFAARAGLQRLRDLRRDGLLTEGMWTGLREDYEYAENQVMADMNRQFREHVDLEWETLLQARRAALSAERGALADAQRRGLLSSDVYERLRDDATRRLEALDIIEEAILGTLSVREEE